MYIGNPNSDNLEYKYDEIMEKDKMVNIIMIVMITLDIKIHLYRTQYAM